jgi:methionyl-tRNA formyltransferase
MAHKIVLLAGQGFSSNVVYHAVDAALGIDTVILEQPVDKKTFLRRRIKKLGLWKVAGQVLFQVAIVPVLSAAAGKRKRDIITKYRLDDSPIPQEKTKQVASVNSDESLRLLQQLMPDLIIVNGTRIISKNILSAVPCRFLNTHAGITPKYRGVHGTYWALANEDAANSGVTVHIVDPGIDTGGILYQSRIEITKADNFTTYPLIQLAEGIPLLIKAARDALGNTLEIVEGTKESRLWHHPDFFGYLYRRVVKNVK